MKRKVELGIHLIKENHGITKGRKPLATLPQIFPLSLIVAFIQPLDKKTKMKEKMSTTVYDIRKLTLRICTQVNTKKFLFATSALRICHKALPGDRQVSFDTHSPLPFALRTLVHFPFSTWGTDSEGSIKVTGSSLVPWP